MRYCQNSISMVKQKETKEKEHLFDVGYLKTHHLFLKLAPSMH